MPQYWSSNRTARRVGTTFVAALCMAALAACTTPVASRSPDATGNGADVPDLTAESFTADFSAMERLTDLAAEGKGLIGVLLPDTTSSARYVSFDAPYLKQAFETAGLDSSQFRIDNAQGSAATMQAQAEADMSAGASVLLVDALDSGSGAAIEAAATARGVKVIDYDRLVKGGTADRIYVGFDNVQVGRLIGEGAVSCIDDWKVESPNILILNGDPADTNAKLLAEGYNAVLKPKFDGGDYLKAGDPAGSWAPSVTQDTFAQQYAANPKINAVVTPNDDNANAVIEYLKSKKIPAKTFPATGQDASLVGLRNILMGYQCGTVYKPIYLEAQAAAAAAIYLRAGKDVPAGLLTGSTVDDSAKADVPSVLLAPLWVTAKNMADAVVADGSVKASDLCIAEVKEACTEAGIK